MRLSRYADFSPLLAFALVIGIVYLLDRERSDRVENDLATSRRVAEQRVAAISSALGNELSARITGPVTGARMRYTALTDATSERAFIAALDSASGALVGVSGVSMVHPETERVISGPQTSLGRRIFLQDSLIRPAFVRAVATRARTATGILEYGRGRRVLVFEPVAGDSSDLLAVLAIELDPLLIYQAALRTGVLDSIADQTAIYHALYGPGDERLNTVQLTPPNWESVSQVVPVADTNWRVEMKYPPPDLRAFRRERIAWWIAGLVSAAALAVIVHFLRRTIVLQKDEIARRQAAEEAARAAAAESRERAKEARDLTTQLEAAQRASQRLSTSLDPDDVVELFLGGVAEILEADVASLYTFEEEGELLVGRRRMVFRDIEGISDRLRDEDIRQVRAPVALLPALGEAVSTGEPYVVENASEVLTGRGARPDTPAASVTVPLLIAGHTVGVASWEVYSGPRRFSPAIVAFAQALAAPAAAALRTAELFLSAEAERSRASREVLRFGGVLDQMADGVIVVDANGRLERSNAAAEELLGDGLDEAPVDEWPTKFDLVSIEGRPLTLAEFPLARAMRGERVRRGTFIVRSDWGTERHLSYSAGPIMSQSGEPAGAAMVLRDVTDEHQYAEMLRHTNRELRRQAEVLETVNRQLREATKAKDQFLAVMSHELRTPINAIMGYSDLLDLGVKGPLNDDQRAMLTRVRETSKHLLGLINEVLDLAKIGAGRMDLITAELDAGSIVERAVQQILPLAASKGLRLEVEPTATKAAVIVRADETRLMQILVNLLSNAVKFTQQGEVKVSYEDTGDGVSIRVADTGPGIPEDQVERIFDEFYQVEGGLSRSSGGTGLGLAIARRFARLMDGDITVETELGHGSVFTVELPGAEAYEAEAEESNEPTVVLLAHDRVAVERLREDLEGSVRLIGATESSQLTALARRERPCLVALDARAPDNGAWRTLAALQGDTVTATIPTLLFAHEDGNAETALDLGVFTVLSKPISVEHATEVVRDLGAGAGVSVLVADDDADVRRILGEALSASGCEVHTAASGGEVLEITRRLSPAVAVIDLLMPGMEGVEAIAAIRFEPSLRSVRVVALASREFAAEEMARLAESVDMLGRSHRARSGATGALLMDAVEVCSDRTPGAAA